MTDDNAKYIHKAAAAESDIPRLVGEFQDFFKKHGLCQMSAGASVSVVAHQLRQETGPLFISTPIDLVNPERFIPLREMVNYYEKYLRAALESLKQHREGLPEAIRDEVDKQLEFLKRETH